MWVLNVSVKFILKRPTILMPWLYSQRTVFKPVQYGALTQLFAGTSTSITADKNGSYLVPLAEFTNKLPHVKGNDAELQKQVWKWNDDAMKAKNAD